MLRLALWLIVLPALALYTRWIDLGPAEPTRSDSPPAHAELHLRIYSPRGWLSTTRGFGESLFVSRATEPPQGWCVLFESHGVLDSVLGLLDALALAEVHNLHETRVGFDPSLADVYPRLGSGERYCVFPAWDVEKAAREMFAPQFDPFETFSIRPPSFVGRPALQWTPGAAIVRGAGQAGRDEAQAYLDSFRREPAWRQSGDEREYPAFHAGPELWEPVDDLDRVSGRILVVAGPGQLAWDVELCHGGVTMQVEQHEHADVDSILDDARTIRASWELQGSFARRRVAWQAALSDDDPLALGLAVSELAAAASRPSASEVARALEACVVRGYDPSRLPRSWPSLSLFGCLPPGEAIPLIERLVRVTPYPDDLGWLLAEGLAHPAADVHRAARVGVLTRLPRGALRGLAGRDVDRLWSPAEREVFLSALHERVCVALRDEADFVRLAELAADVMDLSESDFMPPSSPARSRLRELGGWLVLDPRLFERLQSPWWWWRTRSIALAERLRDIDPDGRRHAMSVLRALRQAEGRRALSEEASEALQALEGDEATDDQRAPAD